MTTLYLVRHGETYDNKKSILQGWMQGELNENGIKQAEKVAEKLCHEPIDVFMSSDLKRAIDTCEIIARPHKKAVVTTELLRERDWGSFTGKYIPDLRDVTWPEDVESLEHLKKRARTFLEMLVRQYPGKCVLAVGHGIVNKAIQSVYFNKQMNEIEKMQNGEVRIYRLPLK